MLISHEYDLTIARMWCDNASSKFIDSLVELIQFTEECGYRVFYDKGQVSWHTLGRNLLAEGMQGEWILMLDTDHIFAPDLYMRMKRHIDRNPDIRVLSGIYQSKHPPHSPVMGVFSEDGQSAPIIDWDREAQLLQVGTVGGGVLLVHRSVFTEIREKMKCNPFDLIGGLSEDYSFCWRCRELGIPVYVAPQIESHHMIQTALSVRDYPVDMEGLKISSQNGKISVD